MIIRSLPYAFLGQQKNIPKKYALERRLFKVLVATLLIALSLYIYSLGSVIYGVVSRRSLEKEVGLLKRDIGISESTYLQKTESLSYTGAITFGLTKPIALYYESEERVAFNTREDQRNGF